MNDTLRELSDLAGKLNQASDRINSAIADLNRKIANLGLGAEVWLSDEPIWSKEREEMWLGYCEIEHEWQLATMLRTCDDRWDGSIDDAPDEEVEVECRPLLKVSRGLRLDGLLLAPKLVQKLKSKAETLLEDISRAEAVAKYL